MKDFIDKTLISQYIDYTYDILLHPMFKKQVEYIQHGKTSVLEHVIEVSFSCYLKYYNNKKIDLRSLVRGALLHDFFLYDWHIKKKLIGRKGLHGYNHPKVALNNASKEFTLSKKERNIIRSHMWPLTFFHFPCCKEAWIVSLIDKKVSYKETIKNHGNYSSLVIKELENRLYYKVSD